jgi:DNA polymerase-3 subunit alpha (Gram-positive type)
MENVRKGKGLIDDMETAMLEAGVPDWYIWSCKQIKYMFPKAHAVAYVMMAYRIAFFKVYYKEAYYATFFSIRATDFDYSTMCHGKHHLDQQILLLKAKEIKAKNREIDPETNMPQKFTKKEKDTIKDMKIVQEMYARGIDFMPVDLYIVDANKFQIFDGKIMPALSSIQGLGDKAAENLVAERDKGRFISIEDLRNRTKISKTVIEVMKDNGILEGMQESNQLSLF